MNLLRHLKLFMARAKISLILRLEANTAFLFVVLGVLLGITINVIFFDTIFGKVNALGGWNYEQMLILLGTYNLIDNIAWTSYRRGLNRLERLIRNGEFDGILTKPINSRMYLSYAYVDIVYPILPLTYSLILIFLGMKNYFSWLFIGQYLFALLCALIIHYSVTTIVNAINFFSHTEMYRIFWFKVEELGKYPTSIFNGIVKIIFSFIIPLAFIYSVPASAFREVFSVNTYLSIIAVTIIFYFIGDYVWKFGVKNYESYNG